MLVLYIFSARKTIKSHSPIMSQQLPYLRKGNQGFEVKEFTAEVVLVGGALGRFQH